MKLYLYIFAAVLIGLIAAGCENSLGYDPDVQATLIDVQTDTSDVDDDPNDGDPVIEVDPYFVDDFDFKFIEKYYSRHEGYIHEWVYTADLIRVKIDTAEPKTKLWIDLDLKSADFDQQRHRADLITAMKMNFSEEIEEDYYYLWGREGEENFMTLNFFIKSLDKNVSVSSPYVVPQVIIFEDDRKNGFIRGKIKTPIYSLPGRIDVQVYSFDGEFRIRYK